MKLVWLDINSSYSHSSLALPSIEAQRTKEECEWFRVSGTINSPKHEVIERVLEIEPNIIAATVWLFNHAAITELTERLRALIPNVIIILGGPEFLGCNESYLRAHRAPTLLFRGEGEIEFHRWIDVAMEPTKWGSISGLCYIEPNSGKYIDNGICKVANFDQLIEPEKSQFFDFSKPFVQLETTRGCFNTCAFCVSGGDKPVRRLSVDKIAKRLEFIYLNGIKEIRLLDRTFNYNPTYAKELLELFESYHGRLRFHLEIHPAILNPPLRALIEQAPKGLLHLEAGMQSLQQEVLTHCQRIGTAAQALEGLSFLANLDNTEIHADLIAGLPKYTYSQLSEDVAELIGLGVAELQLESLKLLPGTKMREEASLTSIKYSPLPPYEVLETPHISYAELQKASELSKVIDYYYNDSQLQPIVRQIVKCSPNFIENLREYLATAGQLDNPLSQERRYALLYNYIEQHKPQYTQLLEVAWIGAGLSLKHQASGQPTPLKQHLPKELQIVKGAIEPNQRYYILEPKTKCQKTYIFGFNRERSHSFPTLIATLCT